MLYCDYDGYNYDSEPEPVFDDEPPTNDREVDIVRVKNIITGVLHHLIFRDLTTGRSDNFLEPFDNEQVFEFIDENSHNIQQAAEEIFAIYQDEEKLYTLDDLSYMEPYHQDRFTDFLYVFVDTSGRGDDDEDDGIDHFRDEEDFDDDE